MTSLLRPSGAFSHQIVSRVSQLDAIARSCANLQSRVVFNNSACLSALLQFNTSSPIVSRRVCRSFATKPKAHTGRVLAPKRKPAVARSDEAAGVPKKAPAKRAATKKAPAKKRATRKKSAAKESGPKAKSKTKAKPGPKRKILTEKQKATKTKQAALQKTRDLKEIALLDAPKRLPSTAFTVLSTEASGKGLAALQVAKDASAQYKNLEPEEMERLNHVANENKAKNDAAYKKWLSEHTPTEIKAANAARVQLKRQAKKDGRRKHFSLIQDERIVKQSRSAYTYFLMDRFASGDMKHMKISEIGPLIGREWKALSAEDRKPFDDRAAKDRLRYNEEYTTVYGTAPAYGKRTAKKAT